MQKRGSFRDNILTVLFVVILVAIGYMWYSYLSSRPQKLVGSSLETAAKMQESSRFLALLSVLEKLTIDDSFFEDPLFRGLGEKVELPPLPSVIGRPNPFEATK